VAALAQHRADRPRDRVGMRAEAQMPQHQERRDEKGHRVRAILPGELRRVTVNRLEHRHVVAQIGAGDDTDAADQARTEIRHQVTVEVLHHHDVELVRVHDQLHAGVVDDQLLVLDLGVLLGHGAAAFEEHAVRALHDVRLVNGGDLPALLADGELEREARDARRRRGGRYLDALDDTGNHPVLEPGVLAFGVLAHDHHVDAGETARAPGKVPHRSEIGVEVEHLAQGHARALERVPRPYEPALQRDAVPPDRLDRLLGERRAVMPHRFGARRRLLPLDRHAGGREDADDGVGHLRADPVPGDERHPPDGMRHDVPPLTR
jgi:hypothetical protein